MSDLWFWRLRLQKKNIGLALPKASLLHHEHGGRPMVGAAVAGEAGSQKSQERKAWIDMSPKNFPSGHHRLSPPDIMKEAQTKTLPVH